MKLAFGPYQLQQSLEGLLVSASESSVGSLEQATLVLEKGTINNESSDLTSIPHKSIVHYFLHELKTPKYDELIFWGIKSIPSWMWPRVWFLSTHPMLVSICIIEIVIEVGIRKERKTKKRPGLARI